MDSSQWVSPEAHRMASHRFIDPAAPKKTSPLFAYLYILCLVLAGTGDSVTLGDKGMYLKVCTLGSVLLTFLFMLKYGGFRRLRHAVFFGLLFLVPIVFILTYSLALWSAQLEAMSFVTRGVEKTIFQVITILTMMCGVYMFGGRVVDYTFYGIAGANLVILLMQAVRTSPVNVIYALTMELFLGASPHSKLIASMEINDITFCMGLFIIYYINKKPYQGKRWVHLLIAAFFFLLGMKRIAIPGMVIAAALFFFLRRMKPKTARGWILAITAAMVGLSFLYIIYVSNGGLTKLLLSLNIDMAGRDRIYKYIRQYYEVSPSYLGLGFEYTVALLRGMRDTGTQVIMVTGIHNDILKYFIELGFWGDLFWLIYTFVLTNALLGKRYGRDAASLCLQVNIYLWITYLTDNTSYYFFLSMSMRIITAGFAMGVVESTRDALKGGKRQPQLLDDDAIQRLVNEQ